MLDELPPSGTTQPDGSVQFDHAAMLMGRPLYWNTAPQDHVVGVNALLRWSLELPGARLGVSLTGIAQIVQSIYEASPHSSSPEIQDILGRIGTRSSSIPAFAPDSAVWGPHLNMLLSLLVRSSYPSSYVWLEEQEVDTWLTATMQSLAQFNEILDSNVGNSIGLRLLSRHECTVFAPFDGASIWDRMSALATALESPLRERLETLLSNPQFTRDQLASITRVF